MSDNLSMVAGMLRDFDLRYTKIGEELLIVKFSPPEVDCRRFGYGRSLDLLIQPSAVSDELIDLMVPTQMGEEDLPAMTVLATNGKLVGCRIGVADTGNRPLTYLVLTTVPVEVLLDEGKDMIVGQLDVMADVVCRLCHMAGVHQQVKMMSNARNN